jgi:hypothetical protein
MNEGPVSTWLLKGEIHIDRHAYHAGVWALLAPSRKPKVLAQKSGTLSSAATFYLQKCQSLHHGQDFGRR